MRGRNLREGIEVTESRKAPQSRRRLIIVSVVSVLLILAITVGVPGYFRAKVEDKEAETRYSLHGIQIELERYYTDYDRYPADIQTLVEQDYSGASPTNAFTKRPMVEIPFGAYPFEGAFTYIPIMGKSKVRAYYLIGYGSENRKGQDVDDDGVDDHVTLALENGWEPAVCFSDPEYYPDVPPPLAECLEFLKENPQALSVYAPDILK